MKILSFSFVLFSGLFTFGQKTAVANMWYVENRSLTELKKSTIMLTLDSIVKKVKDNDCVEVYAIKSDGTFYNSNSCTPSNPEMKEYLASWASYSEGIWVLNSMGELIFTVKVKEKAYVNSYTVQRISDRKMILREK